MKKFFVTLLLLVLFLPFLVVRADSLSEDIEKNNKQLQEAISEYNGTDASLQQLLVKLNEIKINIGRLEKEIGKKEIEVKQGEDALSYQKNLLNERARSYYKNVNKNSTLFLSALVADDLSASLRKIFYQKSIVDEDKRTIIKIVMYVKNLEEIKKNLEMEKIGLAKLKIDVDKQSEALAIKKESLKSKIAELTAKQQQLIAQKLSSLNISRSSSSPGRCDSDLTNGRDPGFSPKFAFFTYGVPHRNGMSQYGAWGRAKKGQNEEQILQFYYPNFSLKKDYDQNAQVNVEGHGQFNIEDYVKRIYEVPDSWTDNNSAVLKAQAVAARSYALNSMKRNGSICTSESCQVFKPEPKGGNWDAAVESTKGWVLMDGDSPAFSQYASTHGGYIVNLNRFDGEGGNPNSFGELNERAYDKESPWFYCDWGSRSQYNKTAWLKPEELADIVNTILLAKVDSSTREHLYQPDNPPAGTENWNQEKVKQELRSRGQNPFNSINDGSVSADFSSGRVNSVSFSGDAGNISFSLSEFKDWFNLRAPANIQIVGPLFNVEKR